jgi:hypothetical protein
MLLRGQEALGVGEECSGDWCLRKGAVQVKNLGQHHTTMWQCTGKVWGVRGPWLFMLGCLKTTGLEWGDFFFPSLATGCAV